MVVIPPPVGLGRDTRVRAAARERLARVLWDDGGARRLPRERELVAALGACDPRDAWWTCEMSSAGPVYLLPTREWLRALVALLRRLDACSVLEVGAGDGFLARCLENAAPDLDVVATDDGSWERPRARMSATERRALRGRRVPGLKLGANVRRSEALGAVRRARPDVVLVAWPPPGDLIDRMIPSPAKYILDIGTDGDHCGSMQGWRWNKEFLEGPIARRALCRLDAAPSLERHSRVTLYHAGRHPRHGLDPTYAQDGEAIVLGPRR
jgi:hypothetical protein